MSFHLILRSDQISYSVVSDSLFESTYTQHLAQEHAMLFPLLLGINIITNGIHTVNIDLSEKRD